MTIILSAQTNLSENNVIGNVLSNFGETLGIPGFPNSGTSGFTPDILNIQRKMNDVLNSILGKSAEKFDPNFVESGRKIAVGSSFDNNKGINVETANTRNFFSQTPQISLLFKKRAFSSLQDLYNPIYMDPAEKWLLRATKRLIARKCRIMSDYERLTKIEKMVSVGSSVSVILQSLLSSAEEFNGEEKFNSVREFQNIVFDRQPVKTTTYFTDVDMPFIEELGIGSGVFELTVISSVNTDLNMTDDGSFSLNIEDPYKILFITEEDIEAALRETSLSSIVTTIDNSAGNALNTAQNLESMLSEQRRSRGKSEITIEVGVNYGSGIKAVVDSIGLQINEDNLIDVPEEEVLNETEEQLFISVLSSLKIYQESFFKNLMLGVSMPTQTAEIRKQLEYARDKMRIFYLGKALIQPMDVVSIFIDGGTRRNGEGTSVEDPNFSFGDAVNFATNSLGIKNSVIDDKLLRNEWVRAGEFPDFDTFKKLRTLSLSTEIGVSVFSGLVNSVTDSFNSENGSFSLAVSGTSNMGWLDLSRYNASPSLDQTTGIIYDPLTPFDIAVDKGTGLPTGKFELSDANRQLIESRNIYFDVGKSAGQKLTNTQDMKQDIRKIGNNIVDLYQHAPGLVYKWKEGIMTIAYNINTNNSLSGNSGSLEELRRDVGFFASNTPFDNMDAANVLSTLITGTPYNVATFIQSALRSGSFSVDSTLNSGKDYFHSMLDIQKSNVKVNGGFIPFKSITISPLDLARSIYYQRRISDKSIELSQLRTQQAELRDQISNISENIDDLSMKKKLATKLNELSSKIDSLSTSLSEFSQSQQEIEKNLISVTGSDHITFDLESITDNEQYKLFGDKLAFSTLRRREDVIRNRDKNYFIVSDDYDKDYDIQAFVLMLKERAPDMWKSSWQPVKDLCRQVANTLDFEFFCSTQGHLVFRPPQYNRIPKSLLEQMLTLHKVGGVKLFPEFLISLFQSKEQSLLLEIKIIEWEIRKQAALLGKNTIQDISIMIAGNTGNNFEFLTDNESRLSEIIKNSRPLDPSDQLELKRMIKRANASTQLKNSSGLFNVSAQINLQKQIINNPSLVSISDKGAYDEAVNNLATLTGIPKRDDEFSKVKVGALKNGRSTPSTDVSRVISEIDRLVIKRSQILRSLDKIVDQNIEITAVNSDGSVSPINSKTISSTLELSDTLSQKLIEDDETDYLGHMSGARFIIQDESIISCSFTERPPEFTVATVQGSMEIVGGKGEIAGMPMLTAYGVDFDLWRQYGFRTEKTFDKPYFSSAEYQCAPYAVMLLSRQRSNILSGNITIVGNEFYQLGDVVYIAHRQMLYYVTKISHSFGFDSSFQTTLELKYGHPVGQYIPTPLDMIGKMQTNKNNFQNSYRVRRDTRKTDSLLGTVVFDYNSTDLFGGKHAKRNYEQLVNALTIANTEIDKKNVEISARVYCSTFFGEKNIQEQRCNKVSRWLNNPEKPGSPKGGIGKDGVGGLVSKTISKSNDINKFNIILPLIKIQVINQKDPTDEDLVLIEQGIVASQETYALDPSASGVVEIRLRRPPVGGWDD